MEGAHLIPFGLSMCMATVELPGNSHMIILYQIRNDGYDMILPT